MGKTWNDFLKMLSISARNKREILVASFELTSRCNQRCKMCYVNNSVNDEVRDKELSARQWINLAHEARDAGLILATLTGGEIFLRKDFREIYEGISNSGLVVQLLTNGTLITPEIIKWLSKIPPLRVGVTLYGASKETCASITGYTDSYERTVAAIDMMLDAGIPVDLRTTVIQGNMKEFDQLSQFAIERDLILGVVNYISPRREGGIGDPEGCRLSPADLVVYEGHIQDFNYRLLQEKKIKFTDSVEELPVRHYKQTEAFQCAAGKTSAWVTWDGRLLACGISPQPVSYPLEKGFLAAWEDIKQQCDAVPLCKECINCKYQQFCESCPARLQNETGFFDKPAPYLCQLARMRYEFDQQFINEA